MNNPPGWYKDPYSDAERFWDGTAWTSQTRIPERGKSSTAGPDKKVIFIILSIGVALFIGYTLIKNKSNSQVPVNNNFIIVTPIKREDKNQVQNQGKPTTEQNPISKPANSLTSKPGVEVIIKPSIKPAVKATPTPTVKPTIKASEKPTIKVGKKPVIKKSKKPISPGRVIP
jgi:hypothetical protein